jgi:hypothetical protein
MKEQKTSEVEKLHCVAGKMDPFSVRGPGLPTPSRTKTSERARRRLSFLLPRYLALE